MAKLVIQTQSMAGRAHELHTDRTTIGRVDDNTFQITDPSVSSHHCEVLLKGTDVVIRDLNSTNGTFINDARISESPLKPGQTLRLGQIELKLEAEGAPATAAPGAPAGAPPPPPKRQVDATMVMPRGVSLSELETSGKGGTGTFESTGAFKKKKKQSAMYFWIGAAVIVLIILGFLVKALSSVGSKQ
ncbi:MAG TPA: FHA domain-containing protein [Verrucomicrobiae bacterium]|jgi:pSer/pThr/pTyr-binding forkhead associated (FHA) protein